MSDNPSDQPKQKTPKGQTIPLPKRGDVLRDLKKIAKVPASGDKADRPKK